jgi:predicted  nucleic acid-binding Zn-ribbon protein
MATTDVIMETPTEQVPPSEPAVDAPSPEEIARKELDDEIKQLQERIDKTEKSLESINKELQAAIRDRDHEAEIEKFSDAQDVMLERMGEAVEALPADGPMFDTAVERIKKIGECIFVMEDAKRLKRMRHRIRFFGDLENSEKKMNEVSKRHTNSSKLREADQERLDVLKAVVERMMTKQ